MNPLKLPTNAKKGFTIIEASIAITFIAILLIAVSTVTVNIISIYQKGLSIKTINSVGRSLIDEFTHAIANSPAADPSTLCPASHDNERCLDDDGKALVYQQRTGNVNIRGHERQVPLSGVLCTGRYSFIWNTGYALNNSQTIQVNHKTPRLLKVADSQRQICQQSAYVDTNVNNYTISLAANQPGTELLANSELQLALYDFDIASIVQAAISSQAIYSSSFTLATLRGDIDITAQSNYCKNDRLALSNDSAYCAINKFNFVARTTGGKL